MCSGDMLGQQCQQLTVDNPLWCIVPVPDVMQWPDRR